jgi:hypothetical protein
MPLLCGNNAAVQTLQANSPSVDRPSQQNKEASQPSQSLFATARRSSVAKWLRPTRMTTLSPPLIPASWSVAGKAMKTFGIPLDQLPTHAASLVPSIVVRMRDYIVNNGGMQRLVPCEQRVMELTAS